MIGLESRANFSTSQVQILKQSRVGHQRFPAPLEGGRFPYFCSHCASHSEKLFERRWLSPNMTHNDCSQSHCLCFLLPSTASTGAAKTSQKTAPQRNPGSKGSPSSSLQRLPSLSSALPSTTGSSTSSTSAGAWKGSPNTSGNPSARGASHASTSGVKTASKTTKEKTYVYEKKNYIKL